MKIKLAILERDKSYLTRIVSAFGTKYADKLEMYSFTDAEVALNILAGAKIDVFLSSDAFDIDTARIPNRCAFAYLVDFPGIDTVREQRAICKFQKADLIYKQILSVYSEKASTITGFKMTGDAGQTIAFCSASGGVGCSTMAAACAAHFAAQGSRVLYLNLETFGSADVFFSGEGQFGMSDIIFALKSKKTNLSLKLESCVKQDLCGVCFYSQAKLALDMMELNTEDILRLITELKMMGEYDYIILDMEFSLNKEMLKIYRQMQGIVMVGDGSVSSNSKTERAFTALSIMESNADAPLTNRMSFLYNKTSNKSTQTIDLAGLKVLGAAPKYAGATEQQIVAQLAAMDCFEAIL